MYCREIKIWMETLPERGRQVLDRIAKVESPRDCMVERLPNQISVFFVRVFKLGAKVVHPKSDTKCQNIPFERPILLENLAVRRLVVLLDCLPTLDLQVQHALVVINELLLRRVSEQWVVKHRFHRSVS